MDPLFPTSVAWLDRPRRVGTPRHWAKNASVLGALLGWWVPASILASMILVSGESLVLLAMVLLNPLNLASALTGALAGWVLGLGHPAVLDRLRGHVPVLAVAAGQSVTGAVAGGLAGAAWSLPLSALDPGSTLFLITGVVGAVIGALITPLWWLPFTVSTVLGRQWPVTMAVAVGVPALLVPICAGLATLF